MLNKKINDFLLDFSDMLNVPVASLKNGYSLKLNSLWDSLSKVETIALIDKHFRIPLRYFNLDKINVVDDLLELIEGMESHTNEC